MLEGMWPRTGRPAFLDLYRYWIRVFSIVFGMGVVSGPGITVWLHAVPPGLTLWEVSSPPASQFFQLVGTAIMLPIVLAYTIHSYRVFRGKVTETDGYH